MKAKSYLIRVIPNSKTEKIVEEGDSYLKIKLTAPAYENKANKAVINFLANHFKIAKNRIKILSGNKSREKKIEINF